MQSPGENALAVHENAPKTWTAKMVFRSYEKRQATKMVPVFRERKTRLEWNYITYCLSIIYNTNDKFLV